MGNNYYMVIVNNLRFGEEQLEASQIVEALFGERTWLFAQSTPSVESLQSGDKVVIYGTSNGKGYFLGSFTLKTSPQPITDVASSNIVNRLSQLFSLSCYITDEVLWENRKPIVDLPNLSFLEDKEHYSLYLRQGLRQLSQSDYDQITKSEESATEEAPSIPNFESFMLPLLRYAGDGKIHSIQNAYTAMATHFDLTEEQRQELLPSGTQVLKNRVGWARTYLVKAGLLQVPKRGYFQITHAGQAFLDSGRDVLTEKELQQYALFRNFKGASKRAETAIDGTQKLKQPIEQMGDLTNVYDAMLNTAQWLLELINEEIPKRQDTMVDLVRSLHRIPRLEEELVHLQNLLETQTSNVILLQEENRKQAQRIEELLLSQSDSARREEEARRAYEQELQELRLERGALTEVTGIKKTLQRIFETLQGKGDDSTLPQ